MYSSYKFLERCPLYFQIVLNLVEWPMIHGLHVVEGCTEGIRFGAWKGWSVVALKGQEKAGEEKVWVDLKPPLRRVGRSLASLVGAAQASQEANIVGELISAEGESDEIGRWVHGGAGFWGLLSNIETSQIRAWTAA